MSAGVDHLKHFLLYHAPAICYMCLIFFMSSLPSSKLPSLPFINGDKLVHCLEFGLLGMLLFRAFRFPPLCQSPFRLAMAVGIPFAASDEIHQLFTPGRSCDIFDFLVDCLGLIIFAWISSRQHPMPVPSKTPEKTGE